jgi:hypothetical protein
MKLQAGDFLIIGMHPLWKRVQSLKQTVGKHKLKYKKLAFVALVIVHHLRVDLEC